MARGIGGALFQQRSKRILLCTFSQSPTYAPAVRSSPALPHTPPSAPPPPRNTLRKMAAASAVDLPGRTSGSMQERLAAMSEATEAAAAATKAAAARRIRNELSRKHVRLRVERSKTQRHVFHTKLSTGIVNIANGCRRERALLSRDEEDADLSLYYEVR